MDDGISPFPSTKEALPNTSAGRSSSESVNKRCGECDDAEPTLDSEGEHTTEKPSLLSRLALPVGLAIGGAITAGTTYALVARVQHLIANASVDGDIGRWKEAARTTGYDACYLGCDDCSDPSFAYNACQLTARANVPGAICDGNRMWNWADRYPERCLAAVGQILMGEELARVKQGYRNQLAIIILTVLGGVVGGAIAYILWRRATMSKAQRTRQHSPPPPSSSWSIRRATTWKRTKTTKHTESYEQRTTSRPSSRHPSRRSSSSRSPRPSRSQPRLSTIITASVASLASRTSAYACMGYAPSSTVYFASLHTTGNTNAITGSVYGWLSDCRDKKVCSQQKCSTSCTTSNGKQSCTKKCTEQCRTVTSVVRRATAYVEDVVPRLQRCGFRVVAEREGRRGGMMERVGNARLERDLWVRVEVSGFNVTRAGETDEGVWCLWGIGGS
ncbi:hypothetical protein BT67DRAFT_477724 [Trichocladium antarcticum]|uniref:Uncharacterized protein n=1 Tax=Trichocladium antarcticum TaxID=1450529 RepID=A0AAN6UJ15_9PEZI|nr:hypothetical protein BT67DRAFT_477724 [Trichocladium antarcticum]